MGTEVNRRLMGTVLMIIVAASVALGGAGVAYAYWTAGGSGSAVGGTGTTVPVVLGTATPSAALQPGSSSSVVLTVSNSNAAQVRVNSFALDTTQGVGGFAVDAGHSGCDPSVLTFAPQNNGGASMPPVAPLD